VGAGGKPGAHAFLHSRGEWDVEPRADDCSRRRSSGLDLHACSSSASSGSRPAAT
jgi:hypothetical protein